MKIKTAAAKITQFKEADGLFSCAFTHTIKETSADMAYTGPKFSVSMWEQILSFFAWTYEECKSESQVRLYVNARLNEWRAWAMPQEHGTGMTARELDTPATATQRAQFRDSEGWVYLGTVHHHCASTAFQSSTDKNNETTQDGIHITVGLIDKAIKDIHVRFYQNGCEFEVDLSKFWELSEDELAGAQLMANKYNVKISLHDLALGQMKSANDDVEFPEQWKRNLIRVERPVVVTGTYQQGGGLMTGHHGSHGHHFNGSGWKKNTYWQQRADEALKQLETALILRGLDGEELETQLTTILTSDEVGDMMDILKKANLDREDLVDAYERGEVAASKLSPTDAVVERALQLMAGESAAEADWRNRGYGCE